MQDFSASLKNEVGNLSETMVTTPKFTVFISVKLPFYCITHINTLFALTGYRKCPKMPENARVLFISLVNITASKSAARPLSIVSTGVFCLFFHGAADKLGPKSPHFLGF
jgi:hypothetical protein